MLFSKRMVRLVWHGLLWGKKNPFYPIYLYILNFLLFSNLHVTNQIEGTIPVMMLSPPFLLNTEFA